MMVRNGHELIKYCQIPHDFDFQFLPNAKSRLIKIELDNETLRLIHNFVSSAKTLVDISRNYSNKYINSSYLDLYKKSINENILPSVIANFVSDLRNFILHRDMPTIGNTINRLSGIGNSIYLHTPTLLEWDKWSSISYKFIQKQNENDKRILIDNIANQYMELSEEITKILFNYMITSNSDDLNNVYIEVKKITENAEIKGMITDPLIVQFYTEDYGFIFPSSNLGN
jgi:hypothetical protein